MREMMPRRTYSWGAPFHVSIFLSHSTIDVFTIHDTVSPHPACRPPSPARGRGAGGEGVPPIGGVVTYLEILNRSIFRNPTSVFEGVVRGQCVFQWILPATCWACRVRSLKRASLNSIHCRSCWRAEQKRCSLHNDGFLVARDEFANEQETNEKDLLGLGKAVVSPHLLLLASQQKSREGA